MARLTPSALALALALPLGLVVTAGCGNDRIESGSLFDAPRAQAAQALRYPDAGLTVSVPKEFSVKAAAAPQLFRASLNEAFLSSFAYRREEQLPKTRAELRTARRRLVDAAKKRDKTWRLRSTRLTKVAGAPAIEVVGDQTIFMGKLRIRSLHVYKGNGEYVVELAAPRTAFRELERASFPGIRRSLKVTGRVKKPKAPAKKTRSKKDPSKESSRDKSG